MVVGNSNVSVQYWNLTNYEFLEAYARDPDARYILNRFATSLIKTLICGPHPCRWSITGMNDDEPLDASGCNA